MTDGINTVTQKITKVNGTYTYIITVYDSTGKEANASTSKSVLVRFLTPVFEDITESATQQNVVFAVPGYEAFRESRPATWSYYFSKSASNPTLEDFGYHGVPLTDTSSFVTFAVNSSTGQLDASAKTPLGLNGSGYRLFLMLSIGDENIIFVQDEAFEIYIDSPAAAAMKLSNSYSLSGDGEYDGTLTTNGNSLIVANNGDDSPSLMAYNSSNNDQLISKVDREGNTIWMLDLSVYGLRAQVIEDINEETLILATGKSMNFGYLGINEEFNDVDVVVIRIDENGEIIAVNRLESVGDDKALALTVNNDEYVVVNGSENVTHVYMFNADNEVVWTKEIEGQFTITDVDYDHELVALVGTTETGTYVVDGKKHNVKYRGETDALLITLSKDGVLGNIRALGSSLVDAYSAVSIFGDYIYVLGTTESMNLYNSYGGFAIMSGKEGKLDTFLNVYDIAKVRTYNTTFVGGDGDDVFTSLHVDEDGITIVGTSTSKSQLKVSAISGTYITLPEYEGTVSLVFEYEHSLYLNTVSYLLLSEGSEISSIKFDKTSSQLMLMSTGSSVSLMKERYFNEEDILISIVGKTGYVSVVGDYYDIVISKDGVVLSDSTEFDVDSNGEYVVTVTDTSGRIVTKVIEVSSFIDGSATLSNDANNSIIVIASILSIIVLAYAIMLIKSSKKRSKKIA